MKLKIIDKNSFNLRVCTLQPSGKLYFSMGTCKEMGLSKDMGIIFAIDEDNKNSIYFTVKPKSDVTLNLSKTSGVFTCNLKRVLVEVGWDIREKYPLAISPIDIDGEQYYRINKPI